MKTDRTKKFRLEAETNRTRNFILESETVRYIMCNY